MCIDKYYKKALKQIESDQIEKAITTFISGLDHGFVKCAYGILHTVTELGSYTVAEDEAIDIFSSNYQSIKHLAEEGDSEAMVMVAYGILNGFVDDEDEPYMLWLTRAASLGNTDAAALLRDNGYGGCVELSDTLGSEELPSEREINAISMLDRTLTSDADYVIGEFYGINEHCKSQRIRRELDKSKEDYSYKNSFDVSEQ